MASSPVEDGTSETELNVDRDDLTAEETWRLVQWCLAQSADEITLDFYELRADDDPFAPFARPSAQRRHLSYASDAPSETPLYALNDGSIRRLRDLLPEGLLQSPSYSRDGWVENPEVYRFGRPMFGVISHDGLGWLWVSKDEREALAKLGIRTTSPGEQAPRTALQIGPVQLTIEGHEFPCLAGGAEDDWLRVHFRVESIPRVFVNHRCLDCTLGTLRGLRESLAALAAERTDRVSVRTAPVGFTFEMTRQAAEPQVAVEVDCRGLGPDLPGHVWRFTVGDTDLEAFRGELEIAIAEQTQNVDHRPPAAIPADPERVARIGGRYLLTVQGGSQ